MSLEHIDWVADKDWSDLVLGGDRHRHHHVGQDRYGNWFCRECSKDRIYTIPDEELRYMLLSPRPQEPSR